MWRVNDPLCPLCKEEEETSLHFLGKCCATANIRRLHFDVPFLEPSDLKQAHWISLLRFAKTTKRFQFSITNWFIRGSALGPIGGLSARQFNGCLPRREEKHVHVVTSSSAVAKRPCDASCLSVVSFYSIKRRVESFIVSYIGYRFITAYD